MNRFRVDNGMFYFIFANNDDTYILDSLFSLELNQYLWYELKQSGYNGIYFLSGENGDYNAEIYDIDSFRVFEKAGQKMFSSIKKAFGGNKEFTKAAEIQIKDPNTVRRKLEDILCGQEEYQAVVITLDTFCELYGTEEGNSYLLNLIGQGTIQKRQKSHNIVLLVSSVMAESSFGYLTSGIWNIRDEKGNVLCSEMALLNSGKLLPLYDTMRKNLNDRCIMLNTFSKKQVGNLVSRALIENGEKTFSAQQQNDITEYLFHWVHDEKFRKFPEAENLFRENELKRYNVYLEDLKRTAVLDKIEKNMAYIHATNDEELIKSDMALRDRFGKNVERGNPTIYVKNALTQKVDSVKEHLPEEVARKLVTIYNLPISTIVWKSTDIWLDKLDKAVARADQNTANRIVKALCWVAEGRGNYNEDTLKNACESYANIVNASEKLYEFSKIVAEEEKRLNEQKYYILNLQKDPSMSSSLKKEQEQYNLINFRYLSALKLYKDCEKDIQVNEDLIAGWKINASSEAVKSMSERIKANLSSLESGISELEEKAKGLSGVPVSELNLEDKINQIISADDEIKEKQKQLLNEFGKNNNFY